ncbi:MAG: methylmalonyl-CoA mutase family protein [Bacillota bacterium]|nr:methylmalonyl-CoA mutase family protein [Bacillota bacterium]
MRWDEEARTRHEAWLERLEAAPRRRQRFATPSGLEVKPLYTPEDLPDAPYAERLGFPGEYPFTRGIYPSMYRGRTWTMRQYAGYATAEESNRRYRYLLEQGQTGLSVAFDLPTQIGYDSDHPLAFGEVGRVGVAIDTVEDMERLFEGIPLDRVSTSMTINATAATLLAFYIVVAERRGIPPEKLSGTVQNDILKEYAARGTYIYPPGPSMRLVTDLMEFCAERVPNWNTISISGYHIREAGATAVEELAFTLADGIAYVRAAVDRGLEVDRFAPRLSFFFNAHMHFFEEIAKFRAARRMWAKIMRERFGARDPRSWMLRFHTQTAGSTLTAQQPENNVVRVTLQALAAVLGGTQSLHTNARDEALALPTEESARLALRTQQILALESGVADTADPLGGSYFVEALTDRLEQEAWQLIEEIDRMGGAVRAVEEGWMQERIRRSAYRYQRAVESGEQPVVGVNVLRDEEGAGDPASGLLQIDPAVERDQVERLRAYRARRDAVAVARARERLEQSARDPHANLLPPILEAARAGVTLGEIADTLRAVFGEYGAARQAG